MKLAVLLVAALALSFVQGSVGGVDLAGGEMDGVYGTRFLAFGVYVMKITGNVFTANFVEMGEDNACYGLEFSLDESTKSVVFNSPDDWQTFLDMLTLRPRKEDVSLTYVKSKKGDYSFMLKIANYPPLPMTKTWAGTRQRDLHMPRKLMSRL